MGALVTGIHFRAPGGVANDGWLAPFTVPGADCESNNKPVLELDVTMGV